MAAKVQLFARLITEEVFKELPDINTQALNISQKQSFFFDKLDNFKGTKGPRGSAKKSHQSIRIILTEVKTSGPGQEILHF